MNTLERPSSLLWCSFNFDFTGELIEHPRGNCITMTHSNLLCCNCRHRVVPRALDRISFVYKCASTKAKVNPADFQVLKDQFLFDVEMIVKMIKFRRSWC